MTGPVVHDPVPIGPVVRAGGDPVQLGGNPQTGGTAVVVGVSGVTEDDLDALEATLRAELGTVAGAVTVLAARPRDYPHSQSAPATVWQVHHGLGFLPGFVAYDTNGREIRHGNVTHPVPGEVMEVEFGAPFAGSGYAS